VVLYGKDIKYTEANQIGHDHSLSVPVGKWHGLHRTHMAKVPSEESALSALSNTWIFFKRITML